MDELSGDIDAGQREFYGKEWQTLELSDKPGRSGWRTSVPAPDFLEFVDWLEEQKITGTALDLGCGGGWHAIVLAKHGFDVHGIDFAEAAIRLASKNAADEKVSHSAHFQVGDALALPYGDNFFDVVNDDGCLHHISPDNWPLYVQNVSRVMQPEGILRIKVFSNNCEYFEENAINHSQWARLGDSGYTYFFSEQDIKDLFGQEFKIIRLEEKTHTQAGDKKFLFGILQLR